MLKPPAGFRSQGVCPEVRIPVTKGLLQALIEHLSAHLLQKIGGSIPSLPTIVLPAIAMDFVRSLSGSEVHGSTSASFGI
ncbi:MAG: hypothetical protein WCC08_04815 [Terrimicrobiaceae bacterium]